MEVNPDKQNIDKLFSTTDYHIDFYQREYKWTTDEVTRLIEDIFYHFEQSYRKHSDLDATEANVAARYSWYYLNTYITNKTNATIYVVDGQQRLTTLTLMLISLHHRCGELNSPELADWLKAKIAGVGKGGKRQFWMAHSKREPLMQALFNGAHPSEDMIEDGITARHIIANYAAIQSAFASRLGTRHKLDTFVYYFLCMVVIINLEVAQTDVPMVFEVINDRGVRLQPYEILKGKLLGQIDKQEVDQYADIWEAAVNPLETRADDEVDNFFRTYLRAHFADTRKQGQAFDGPYHRTIFDSTSGCENKLHLKDSPHGVKRFLQGSFRYYAKLFLKLHQLGDDPDSSVQECYFISQLNRMDGHIMLTVAACEVDDPEEEEKIAAVAKAFDRAYVMLQLNRAYDSNQFQELLYTLHPLLRGCAASEIEKRINQQVLKEINERRNTDAETMLAYGQFKQVGYGDYNTRFLRYFLARIEGYLAAGLGKNLQDSLHNYVVGTGKANAYHIEHILARNDESRGLFRDADGEFDEALFENERNRFGDLLLLKGQDNQSSGNEEYKDKLRSYTGNAPYLAQTLVSDFYKSNTAMRDFIARTTFKFTGAPQFNRETLEQRSQLLFGITKTIWDV